MLRQAQHSASLAFGAKGTCFGKLSIQGTGQSVKRKALRGEKRADEEINKELFSEMGGFFQI
jgi:hypothetical protein